MKQDAALWTYPDTDTITFRGRESATEYTFSSRVAYHGSVDQAIPLTIAFINYF
jgi:hypothetical protein